MADYSINKIEKLKYLKSPNKKTYINSSVHLQIMSAKSSYFALEPNANNQRGDDYDKYAKNALNKPAKPKVKSDQSGKSGSQRGNQGSNQGSKKK